MGGHALWRRVRSRVAPVPWARQRIVEFPWQWKLRGRERRRVVIKEVNPLGLEYFVSEFGPRVIYVIRHPAAVALSFRRMVWSAKGLLKTLFDGHQPAMDRLMEGCDRSGLFFVEHGIVQAAMQRSAMAALQDYEDHRVVRYEDLCLRPLELFRELYDFAGLTWNKKASGLIIEKSTRDKNTNGAHTTSRNSSRMATSWRDRIEQSELALLKAAYEAQDPPHYRSASWW